MLAIDIARAGPILSSWRFISLEEFDDAGDVSHWRA
jgi:hypothetical protein